MAQNRTSYKAIILLMPFILVFSLFQLFPLISVLFDSLRTNFGDNWGLGNYRYIITSSYFKQSIINSIKISFYSSSLGMLLALPCAWSIHRVDGALKHIALSFSNLIANFTGVPLAFAFVILMGTNGILTLSLLESGLGAGFDLYSSNGLILVYSYFQLPLALLLMFPALDGIKEEWREAANLLGASSTKYWLRIGFPILMPSIVGTYSILFANAMGTMATALALTSGNYNLMTIRINYLVSGDIFIDPWLASALAVFLVLLLLIITFIHQRLLKAC